MLNFTGKPVYLACGKTDMRKQINGLAELITSSFLLDPFDEAIFVFCNGHRDRIKILEWDGDGFWLYFKRLEKGRFRWPSEGSEATMTLSGEELQILLGGGKGGAEASRARSGGTADVLSAKIIVMTVFFW